MSEWQRVEVDNRISSEERAYLRKQQAEMSDRELANLYKTVLKKRFEAPEDESKKDRICVLLHTFGTKSNTGVIRDIVDASYGYMKQFRVYDKITERPSGGKTWKIRDELHEKGDAPVVLNRKPFRTNSLSRKTRTAVLERDENQCLRCGSCEDLEIHHIIPHSQGGSDKMQNLAALCHNCHKDATLTRSSRYGEVPAYPSGEFEAWLENDLDICGAKTAKKTLCQNPAGSCPHHD